MKEVMSQPGGKVATLWKLSGFCVGRVQLLGTSYMGGVQEPFI